VNGDLDATVLKTVLRITRSDSRESTMLQPTVTDLHFDSSVVGERITLIGYVAIKPGDVVRLTLEVVAAP
jgi:hypothetical protein